MKHILKGIYKGPQLKDSFEHRLYCVEITADLNAVHFQSIGCNHNLNHANMTWEEIMKE